MKNITYPETVLERPFADTGNKTIIPEDATSAGRASLTSGFPPETQLPLAQGGVSPNRLDVNGVLNMLSGLAFWKQSGGLMQWSATLNYTTPCLVFHNAVLWWCVQDNGPQSAGTAPVEPGTDDGAYWTPFLNAVVQTNPGGGGGSGGIGGDVGDIKMCYRTSPPPGWLACDGSTFDVVAYPQLYALLGKNTTPDMRGLFVRGYDPTATNDPDGTTRTLGSKQADATQHVAGYFGGNYTKKNYPVSGAFYNNGTFLGSGSGDVQNWYTYFDNARVVRTADEDRPKNINLLYCIKAG